MHNNITACQCMRNAFKSIQTDDNINIQRRCENIDMLVQNGCNDNARTLESGGRLNKKDVLTRYGDSHVKDKTT